mmetsp:Transcript_26246/g.84748  ORF Transcript_26246/g.84748 Transcript_26246/m.84748 type:complete len:255 (+) Transcript_26246:1117-1881(+)
MPAPTCSTSAGLLAGSRKSALRTAAASGRLSAASCSVRSCSPSTRPRRGWASGAGRPSGSTIEKRMRVRLCEAWSGSWAPADTGTGCRYCSAWPSERCRAPAGIAAIGALEMRPAAPRGISNQNTTPLARPSSTTGRSSATRSGLMGGEPARKSKAKATVGAVSGRMVRRKWGESRSTLRSVGAQSRRSTGVESMGTPVSGSTCTAIIQTRAAAGKTVACGRRSSSALRLLTERIRPSPRSVQSKLVSTTKSGL